ILPLPYDAPSFAKPPTGALGAHLSLAPRRQVITRRLSNILLPPSSTEDLCVVSRVCRALRAAAGEESLWQRCFEEDLGLVDRGAWSSWRNAYRDVGATQAAWGFPC